MSFRKRPPAIRFYEDDSLQAASLGGSAITSFIRRHSFGLVRTDLQATVLILLCVVGAAVSSYYFVRNHQAVVPTSHFELLPQESVGSEQGLPLVSTSSTPAS